MLIGSPMSTPAKRVPSPIARHAQFVRLGLDDLADARYVHASSFRTITGCGLADEEVQAFLALVHSADYLDGLAELVAERRLLGLKVDAQLVATAGWSPAASGGHSARIEHVFVLALFGRLGLGSRLVLEVERAALFAGFNRFMARTLPDQSPFFARLGYVLASKGSLALPGEHAIPVAHMRKVAAHAARAARGAARHH